MEESILKQIKELISDGKVESITDFVNMCVEHGLRHTLYTWDRGVWYVHGTRICCVSKQNIDTTTSHTNEKTLYEMGSEVGKQFSSNIKYLTNMDTNNRNNWSQALAEAESLSGWGNFLLKNNTITIVSPCPPPEFLRGFLEIFLGLKLRLISKEPLRYEVS